MLGLHLRLVFKALLAFVLGHASTKACRGMSQGLCRRYQHQVPARRFTLSLSGASDLLHMGYGQMPWGLGPIGPLEPRPDMHAVWHMRSQEPFHLLFPSVEKLRRP